MADGFYAGFDPSQYSNPYSAYNNQALPSWSYAGWPTDAMGNPIRMPAGMTLNQTPAQPQAPAAAQQASTSNPMINQLLGWNALENMNMPGRAASTGDPYLDKVYGIGQQQPAQSSAAVQPAQAATANSAGLTPQQYMQLRANPGRVVTPGATVPQSAQDYQPTSGQGGVLQQFLANWRPATSGPGSGFQQGFAKALQGMGYTT